MRPGEPADRAADLERAAIDFEAVFLSEMLRHAGLGQAREAFGGGAGEEVFSSLLTQQWATSLAENGGIGLAEHLLRSLQPYGGGDFGED
ncbi:MAG: rod-binding protein [Pseudomonadota bacterium]